MSMKTLTTYVCLNGEYVKADDLSLGASNRAFLYGDGLFETMHTNGTIPQFIEYHIDRLVTGMHSLKMQIPSNFTVEYFTRHIGGVLTRNKSFMGARVRITVFRNQGGFYTPETNESSFLITSSVLDNDKYVLNPQGYSVDIFQEIRKPVNRLSTVKSISAPIYVMAGIFKSENKLDECIILNEKGRIIESISSNIFLVKDNSMFTPALSEGCLPGVMRKVLINHIAPQTGIPVTEVKPGINDLFNADEIFLTNAIHGIRWVLAFRKKRYYNKMSRELISSLNKLAFRND